MKFQVFSPEFQAADLKCDNVMGFFSKLTKSVFLDVLLELQDDK